MGHEPSSNCRVEGVRDHNPKSYQQALERGNTEDAQYLTSMGLQGEENPFPRFSLCNLYWLRQPDAVHLIDLRILNTMMDWLVGYLQQRMILGRFNRHFRSIPPYPGFQPFKRSYEEVSSWQGKEFRTIMQFLLAVLGPKLINGVQSSESEEVRLLVYVRSIIEFLLVLGQHPHSDYTLDLLDNRLTIFYRSKSVFHPQRSTKTRTKTFKKKWAEMKAKGSVEGWFTQRIQLEKEKLETAIYQNLAPAVSLQIAVPERRQRVDQGL